MIEDVFRFDSETGFEEAPCRPRESLRIRDGVGVRESLKKVVEAAVFLHDENDVLDLARAGRVERLQRGAAPHVPHGGNWRRTARHLEPVERRKAARVDDGGAGVASNKPSTQSGARFIGLRILGDGRRDPCP